MLKLDTALNENKRKKNVLRLNAKVFFFLLSSIIQFISNWLERLTPAPQYFFGNLRITMQPTF